MKINSRIWFRPVNSNFHFEDCLQHRIRCLAGTIPLFICSQRLNIIWLSHISTLSILNDRNIRTASHALNVTDLRFYYTIGSWKYLHRCTRYYIMWSSLITQYYTVWPTSEIKTPTWCIFFYISWKHHERDFKLNHVMWHTQRLNILSQ